MSPDGVQAKAGQKRRELQRQVLFTVPIRPKAGQSVRVYYNPDVTPLRGRPEAWLRGGWNRWERLSVCVYVLTNDKFVRSKGYLDSWQVHGVHAVLAASLQLQAWGV